MAVSVAKFFIPGVVRCGLKTGVSYPGHLPAFHRLISIVFKFNELEQHIGRFQYGNFIGDTFTPKSWSAAALLLTDRRETSSKPETF